MIHITLILIKPFSDLLCSANEDTVILDKIFFFFLILG